MKKKLDGKIALITGGASGIGRALADELSSRGAEVVLADRQIDLARTAADAIVARGGKASAVELDVRDAAAFERVVDGVVRRAGRIDFLFNNAGIAVGGEVSKYEPGDWDDVFDVNLRGVAYGVSAVYPHMIRQRSGHIVNTASVAGLLPAAGTVGYCATKHAVVGMTKALRVEAARHGVRVSAICPGAIRTPILTGGKFGRTRFKDVTPDQILRQWETARPVSPEELARYAVDGVLANAPFIVYPRWWKALWYLDRLSPSISIKVWEMMFGRVRRDLRQDDDAPAPRSAKVPAGSSRAVN